MNRYGFPIVFAAALHGILLFGFNCGPSKAAVSKSSLIDLCDPFLPPPDEIQLIETFVEPSLLAPAEFDMPPVATPGPICWLESADKGVITLTPPKLDVVINDPRIVSAISSASLVASGEIIPSALLDRIPATRVQAPPAYPLDAAKNGLSGEVVIDFTVNEHGDVMQAKVISSTDRIFEDVATRAVLKWKFEPGRRDGRVVPFRMAIPIQFTLND